MVCFLLNSHWYNWYNGSIELCVTCSLRFTLDSVNPVLPHLLSTQFFNVFCYLPDVFFVVMENKLHVLAAI